MEDCLTNNKIQKYISVEELQYLLYFAVMFGVRAAGLFDGQRLYNISLVVGFLLWGAKILVTRHTVIEYGILAGAIGLCFLVYFNTGEKGILLYMTMLLGMKSVDSRKVFRLAACLLGTLFPLLVLSSVFRLIPDQMREWNRTGFGNVYRHSLGYPHPNTLMTTYIILMVLIMIMIGQQTAKKLFVISLCLWLGAIYLFLYSCSNTGIIISTFFLCLNFVLQVQKQLFKIEKLMLYLLYPFLVLVLTIAMPLLTHGNEALFIFLNRLSHTRISLSYYYLTEEKWTIFGSRMAEKYNGSYRYMIDSSFLYSFIQLGVVFFVILSVINMYLLHKFLKEDRRIELAVLISFWILGLSDPFLYNLSCKNLLFVYAGEEFYKYMKFASWNQKKYQLHIIPIRKAIHTVPTFLMKLDGFYRRIKAMILSLEITDLILFLFISGSLWTIQLFNIGHIEEIANIDKWEKIRYALTLSNLIGGVITIAMMYIKERVRRRDYEERE